MKLDLERGTFFIKYISTEFLDVNDKAVAILLLLEA